MLQLYVHITDGGAIYLTLKEHELSTAVLRLDGEPEVLQGELLRTAAVEAACG
jgi:hypothetical protein